MSTLQLPEEIAQLVPLDVMQQAIRNADPQDFEWMKKAVEQIARQTQEEQATAKQREIEQAAIQNAHSERVRLSGSLAEFFRAAWSFLEPGHELTWSWHYDLLCEYLTLVEQKKLRRLIINVPPRTGKSTLVTKCFPVWAWTRNPTLAFLVASYSKDLSTDHSVNRRNLITSNWFQSLWRDTFKLSSDRNLTTQFTNDKMGTMIATSTGSGAEGKGGDIAILDDPMSGEQSLSDAERSTCNRWISNTLKQRLNNPATAPIVLIMQRLHELDTTGFVEEQDPGVWVKIKIPLIAEEDERWEFPISGRIVERKRGDVLQPERYTPEVVQEKKRSRLVFAGYYQQRPAPLEGNLIKRSEVRYYGGKDTMTGFADPDIPEKFDLVIVSADCAFKDLDTSDFVAIIDVGCVGPDRYVLNVVNEHLDVDATEIAIRGRLQANLAAGRRVSAVLVEDKANGPAVISRLKKKISGVVEVEPEGGKIARFFAAAPEWQSGNWHVDRTAAWCELFIQQLTNFPLAAHDDMCDAMSQASIWLQAGEYALGLVDYFKTGMAKKAAEAAEQEAAPKGLQSALPSNGAAHPCPACGFDTTSVIAGNQRRCMQCGHQFMEAKTSAFVAGRKEMAAAGGLHVGRR